MPDLVLVRSEEMTREQLRGIGLRVYGEPQYGGHFVAREALLVKIGESGRRVNGTNIVESGAATYRVANIVFRDGSKAVATVDPNSVRLIQWGVVRGGDVGMMNRVEWPKILKNTLVPVINRDIVIDVPHGEYGCVAHNTVETVFKVHVWGSPEPRNGDEEAYNPPRTLWGHRLPTGDRMSAGLWTEGVNVISPESPADKPIACFDEGNLYIYADLCHTDSTPEVHIFGEIIKFVAANYAAAKGRVDDPVVMRNNYVNLVEKRKALQVREFTNELESVRSHLHDLNRDVVVQIREEKRILKDLSALDNDDAFNIERFASEYDRLVANPLIKSVKMMNGNITVRTNTLCVTDPRTSIEHEVGRMMIHLDIKRYNVVVTNLDRQVHGLQSNMHGPHVFANGRMCLGNMEEVLPKLVAQYQLADAIELVVAILQTCNVDDPAGRKVNCWPLSEKQKAKDAAAKAEAKRLAKAVKTDGTIEVDTRATVDDGMLDGTEEDVTTPVPEAAF